MGSTSKSVTVTAVSTKGKVPSWSQVKGLSLSQCRELYGDDVRFNVALTDANGAEFDAKPWWRADDDAADLALTKIAASVTGLADDLAMLNYELLARNGFDGYNQDWLVRHFVRDRGRLLEARQLVRDCVPVNDTAAPAATYIKTLATWSVQGRGSQWCGGRAVASPVEESCVDLLVSWLDSILSCEPICLTGLSIRTGLYIMQEIHTIIGLIRFWKCPPVGDPPRPPLQFQSLDFWTAKNLRLTRDMAALADGWSRSTHIRYDHDLRELFTSDRSENKENFF